VQRFIILDEPKEVENSCGPEEVYWCTWKGGEYLVAIDRVV